MTQVVVNDFNWVSIDQMIDALGLAETTLGPLILVTQFVATLAGSTQGSTQGGTQGGTVMALLANPIALWMTFIPCFLWIFAGATYVDGCSTARDCAAPLPPSPPPSSG